jgi:hypothetical protein
MRCCILRRSRGLLANRKTDILTTSVLHLSQSGVGNGFAVVNPSDVLNIDASVFHLVSLFSFVSSLCLPVAVNFALVRLVLVVIAGLSLFPPYPQGLVPPIPDLTKL